MISDRFFRVLISLVAFALGLVLAAFVPASAATPFCPEGYATGGPNPCIPSSISGSRSSWQQDMIFSFLPGNNTTLVQSSGQGQASSVMTAGVPDVAFASPGQHFDCIIFDPQSAIDHDHSGHVNLLIDESLFASSQAIGPTNYFGAGNFDPNQGLLGACGLQIAPIYASVHATKNTLQFGVANIKRSVTMQFGAACPSWQDMICFDASWTESPDSTAKIEAFWRFEKLDPMASDPIEIEIGANLTLDGLWESCVGNLYCGGNSPDGVPWDHRLLAQQVAVTRVVFFVNNGGSESIVRQHAIIGFDPDGLVSPAGLISSGHGDVQVVSDSGSYPLDGYVFRSVNVSRQGFKILQISSHEDFVELSLEVSVEHVGSLGDLTGDGFVCWADKALASELLDIDIDDIAYDPRADLNYDGIIDVDDLVLFNQFLLDNPSACGCMVDLTGSADPNDPSYGIPDGVVDPEDYFYFLQLMANGDPRADLTGSASDTDPMFGLPDGVVDAEDYFFFLKLFAAGCP